MVKETSELKKEKLKVIKNLEKTYCRLKLSKINGIGIVAIRDIPKNTNPFEGCMRHKWQKFKMSELKKLDPEVTKMVYDFFAFDENNNVIIPECGLNGLDISFFLNQSKKHNKHNVKPVGAGFSFLTTRDVKKGEELTSSYASYDCRYRK